MIRVAAARPAPVETPDDAPFWEGVRRGELLLPWCAACARFSYPPGGSCASCGSGEQRWTTLPHEPVRGRLVTFSVCTRSFLAFADQVPFVLAVVELAGAPEVRMVGNLLGVEADPRRIALDATVRLEWAEYDDGVVLPQWVLDEGPDHREVDRR